MRSEGRARQAAPRGRGCREPWDSHGRGRPRRSRARADAPRTRRRGPHARAARNAAARSALPPRAGTSVPGPLPVARPANSYRAPATCQAPRRRHGGHQDETATVSVLPRRATSYDDFKRHWKTAMFSHRWRVSPPLSGGDSNTQDPPPASCTRRGPRCAGLTAGAGHARRSSSRGHFVRVTSRDGRGKPCL